MLPVLTREQVRAFDRRASAEWGVPSLLLMENAGRGAAEHILRDLATHGPRRPAEIAIVCGTGNNGGDGFVVARRLATLGAIPRVFLLGAVAELSGDALAQYRAFVGCGGALQVLSGHDFTPLERALHTADAAVDAVFGTGLARPIQEPVAGAIMRLNRAQLRRYALDMPSGIDADSGEVLGCAVQAHVTLTFAARKRGLVTPQSRAYTGRVELIDIGIPATELEALGAHAGLLEAADIARCLRPRPASAHKVSSGKVLVIAGSPGKVGAALLVAQGALRAGAGLVTLAALPEVASIFEQRVLEAMTARIERADLRASLGPLLEQADAVAMGPGLGLDATARSIVDVVVSQFSGRLVLDADALTLFKGRASELQGAPAAKILTPHPGEMSRLLGITSDEVEQNRFSAVERAATLTDSVVLLKGAYTLVQSPSQPARINPTGSPVLATGGTGDVLCGIVAAFACHLEAEHAAYTGAYVHGLAAERCAAAAGLDRGVLAHEIADAVPAALASLSAARSGLSV